MNRKDFKFRSQYKKAIVEEIKKYRSEGGTYREIADIFNESNYETLTGKGKWHFGSVYQTAI